MESSQPAGLALVDRAIELPAIGLGERASASVELVNDGPDVAIQGVRIAGDATILDDACTGTLATGDRCAITLAVTPVRAGALAADVTVTTADTTLVAHVTARATAADHVSLDNAVAQIPSPAPRLLLIDEDPTRPEELWGIAIDASDRRITTGEGMSHPTGLAWTSAISPDGQVAWTDRHDPGTEARDTGFAVAIARDGSTYVAGRWHSMSWTASNAFLRKLSPTGQEVWSHDTEDLGNDEYRAIALDEARGAIYVVGSRPDPGDPTTVAHGQGWIRRLDLAGAVVWEQTWQGAADGDDVALGVAVAVDGRVVVAGRTATAARGSDAWVAAYTPAGELAWSEVTGGAGDDEAAEVVIAADGSIAVAGTRGDAGWLARYDPSGRRLAERVDADVAGWRAVAVAPDGELIAASADHVRAYTPALTPVWTTVYPDLRAHDVAIDRAGNIVVVGGLAGDMAMLTYDR